MTICKLCKESSNNYEELEEHFEGQHPSEFKKIHRWMDDDFALATLGLDVQEVYRLDES